MSGQSAKNLYVNSSGRWVHLPSWVAFHYELGKAIGSTPAETRITAALSLPTRALAAAWITAGAVVTRARLHVGKPDIAAHAARLIALPQNSPVSLERGFRRLPGKFIGTTTLGGETYLQVRVQDKSGYELISTPMRNAHEITILRNDPARPALQHATQMAMRRTFVRCVIGGEHVRDFVRYPRLDTLIVGRKSVLQHEISGTEVMFTAEGSATPCRGKLSDLLRVKQLLQEDKPFRSAIVSSTTRQLSSTSDMSALSVAVFDGALGYLRWHRLWPSAHHIVVLDRTEPRFADAVTTLNEAFAACASPEAPVPAERIPAGVNVFAFRRKD